MKELDRKYVAERQDSFLSNWFGENLKMELSKKPVSGAADSQVLHLEITPLVYSLCFDSGVRTHTADDKSSKTRFDDLSKSILQDVDPKERKRFEQSIKDFQKARMPKLDYKEACATLEHVNELVLPDAKLEAKLGQKPRLNREDRSLVAEQILKLGADPPAVRQSFFNTCESATIEKVVWGREPSSAAALVAQAALRGTIKDGDKELKLSEEAFKKNLESPTHNPKLGERLFCSQIFQTALIEREWAHRADIPGFPAGRLCYRLTKKPTEEDSGERIVDKLTKKVLFDRDDKEVINDPGINFTSMARIYNSVVKHPLKRTDPLVLASNETLEFLRHDKKEDKNRPSMTFIDVHKGGQLEKALKSMDAHKQFPIIVVVRCAEDPTQIHVATISAYNPTKNTVIFDDQLGKNSKGQELTIEQLQQRMRVKGLKQWQLPPRVVLRNDVKAQKD